LLIEVEYTQIPGCHTAKRDWILLFRLFPELFPFAGRHHFVWVMPEKLCCFLPQSIRWMIFILEQKHSQAIDGGHLKHQMIFALAFELIQQIFIGCGKQFTRHRIHRGWRQAAGVNEAEELLENVQINTSLLDAKWPCGL
jgi:hypothetical protein